MNVRLHTTHQSMCCNMVFHFVDRLTLFFEFFDVIRGYFIILGIFVIRLILKSIRVIIGTIVTIIIRIIDWFEVEILSIGPDRCAGYTALVF